MGAVDWWSKSRDALLHMSTIWKSSFLLRIFIVCCLHSYRSGWIWNHGQQYYKLRRYHCHRDGQHTADDYCHHRHRRCDETSPSYAFLCEYPRCYRAELARITLVADCARLSRWTLLPQRHRNIRLEAFLPHLFWTVCQTWPLFVACNSEICEIY